tara:strand:+ start:1153 stop:1665 length:513 start_codon:yes stop_codon:yes gene_type:complete
MEKLKDRIKNYQLNAMDSFSKTLESKSSYIIYETDKYNERQNYLYNRALKGFRHISKEDLDNMCDKKKRRIQRVYIKAQKVVNKLKQKATIEYTNLIFQKLFPDAPITDFLLNELETDEKFKNILNFKDLNIDKDQIIAIFIEEGVLGKNFLSLKNESNTLPRLKNENKA